MVQTKLILDLYLANFLGISVKFFPCIIYTLKKSDLAVITKIILSMKNN